jgi:hypothetical protein
LEKRVHAAMEGVQAWVDPEGYRSFLAAEKVKFERSWRRRNNARVSTET